LKVVKMCFHRISNTEGGLSEGRYLIRAAMASASGRASAFIMENHQRHYFELAIRQRAADKTDELAAGKLVQGNLLTSPGVDDMRIQEKQVIGAFGLQGQCSLCCIHPDDFGRAAIGVAFVWR
jgi:hypothetical protein